MNIEETVHCGECVYFAKFADTYTGKGEYDGDCCIFPEIGIVPRKKEWSCGIGETRRVAGQGVVTMTDKRIEEIKARCEAATPGPWDIILNGHNIKVERTPANIDFIAHAREDIPWLLDQLAEAQRGADAAIQAWHKARERNKELATTCSEAADLIESLQKQLAEAQRRADAAVEDLRRNRKYKCDCCHYANKQGQYTPCRDCQSPISNHGDLWTWRGPQE